MQEGRKKKKKEAKEEGWREKGKTTNSEIKG